MLKDYTIKVSDGEIKQRYITRARNGVEALLLVISRIVSDEEYPLPDESSRKERIADGLSDFFEEFKHLRKDRTRLQERMTELVVENRELKAKLEKWLPRIPQIGGGDA